MKKVPVRIKSQCPHCKVGVTEMLEEITDMLDTLSKFVEGEAKESRKRYERLQDCIYHLQNKKGV